MAIRIDPELERQLQCAAEDAQVQAVLSLSRAAGRDRTPEETAAIAQCAVDEAAAESGQQPSRVKVFRHLDAFAVEGSPRFIRCLMAQEDRLASAVANVSGRPEGDRRA